MSEDSGHWPGKAPDWRGLADHEKYERFASETPGGWWDLHGTVGGLHVLNRARVAYFKDKMGGFAGKKVLDVGCGGGILSESLAGEGALVPFSQVASIELDEGYSFIRRESLQRYSVLQMDVKGRDVDSFVKEADMQLKAQVELPAGYWIEWGGSFENQQRAMARLGVIVPLTIGLIFILLYTAFNSVRHATLIIANVPFAIIGGIVGLFISGQYLSVPSAIGFIAVFGVAMLNGIVMVTFLNDLRRQGLPIREAVQQGAALRLRPVLMTASVAILGLIPMLLSTGVGAETQRPLATVVVGGLFTSTALTLLILPLMYEWAEQRAERRKAKTEEILEGETP